MNNSTLAFLLICLAILAGIMSIGIYLTLTEPTDFQPGMHVTILTNETEIRDGKVCQVTEEAIISFTGKDDFGNWWAARPLSLHYIITVVVPDGTQKWVPDNQLVPFQPADSYCSDITLPTVP